MVAALAGLGFAVWFKQPAMVLVLALGLSTGGLALAWSRVCLAAVTCERHLEGTRLFPGESIEVVLRAENRKPLPLPWLEVEDEVPAGLRHESVAAVGGQQSVPVVRSAGVSWYSAVKWRYRLRARRRGYYPLKPVQVSSGDIFGLYRRTREWAASQAIIVYPRLLEPREMMLPSLNPVGDSVSASRVFEDPSRTVGIRDYSPGDSLRRIHWKATARRAALQVRIFEPTTTLKPLLFLAVDAFPGVQERALSGTAASGRPAGVTSPGSAPGATAADSAQAEAAAEAARRAAREVFEFAISATASLARNVIEQNGQVGLWVNSRLADTGQPATIPPSGGLPHLMAILEALAKVTAEAGDPFAAFFDANRRHLAFGTTPMFVIGEVPEGLAPVLVDLVERGHRPHVIQVRRSRKPSPEEHLPGVAWYAVRPRRRARSEGQAAA